MNENTALTTTGATLPIINIVPAGATGNRLSRLSLFSAWLDAGDRPWHSPDLGAYRDHLLDRMAPNSAKSHLSTIRARYKEILSDNQTDDLLELLAGQECEMRGEENSAANRGAYVARALRRLANGTNPKKSKVKVEAVQDTVDSEVGIRLTRGQADMLLASPGLVPVNKLRDTCILAVMLNTGIRVDELRNLDVDDLRQTLDGRLCLRVRHGKGNKRRAIPWGDGEWVLAYLDKWLARAGISEGAVFRGFYKGNHRMREGRLSVRAIQKTVTRYPVMIAGELTTVHCHDLRRSFARRCYDEGMAIVAIQQNLGHADHKTTARYIGVLDSEQRSPPSLFSPPHWSELDKLADVGAMADLAEQSELSE